MRDDSTLGGYLELHQRAPAFEGKDGHAYSAAIYVDETPGADGRFGAALLFVRWGPAGDHAVGHVETPYLAFASSQSEAEAAIRGLSLWQLKEHLDAALDERRSVPEW